MDPIRCLSEAALLAMESALVVGLRVAALSRGGPAAAAEASHMVEEKLLAGADAMWRLGSGATPLQVVGAYRAIVHANHVRLAAA